MSFLESHWLRRTAAVIFILAGLSFARADGPPNIFIFLSDDLSYHDLGCYGNETVKTPNIDSLADSGLRLDACFNSAPMCAPTRMALYTGIHPVRNGAHPNHSEVYPWVRTLPQYLSELGYRVGLANKTHYLPVEQFPFEHLEGRQHDTGKDGIDFDLKRVEAFVKESSGSPWCFVFASNQPHTPWNRGDPSRYDPAKVAIPPYMVDTPETREAMTHYYAEITYMDGQLGQCIQILEELDFADDTIFIYLGEQGSNFPFCKWTCYETGLRSAGVIRWPGKVASGSVSQDIIQYVDVVPTLIDLAGGDPTVGDFDGRSFKPLLLGEPYESSVYAYGVQTSRGIFSGPEAYGIRSVRDQRFRLIWNVNPEASFQNTVTERLPAYLSWQTAGKDGDEFAQERYDAYLKRPEYELYDVIEDPFSMRNLAGNPEFRRAFDRLREELERWMAQQGDQGPRTEAEAFLRMPKLREP